MCNATTIKMGSSYKSVAALCGSKSRQRQELMERRQLHCHQRRRLTEHSGGYDKAEDQAVCLHIQRPSTAYLATISGEESKVNGACSITVYSYKTTTTTTIAQAPSLDPMNSLMGRS